MSALAETNQLLAERKLNGFSRLRNRAYYTPDFPLLRLQSQTLIFVWGEEKSGYSESHHLDGAVPLGNAFTLMEKYVMKEDAYGPIVFERNRKTPDTQILRGEAYLCSVEHIHSLDTFYLNGILAKRARRNIGFDEKAVADLTPERFRGQPRALAWMYFADEKSVSYDTYGPPVDTEIQLAMTQGEKDVEYYIW